MENCQQICQRWSIERVKSSSVEFTRIVLATERRRPDFIDDLSAKALVAKAWQKRTNDPSSATRRTGGNEGHHDAPAGLDAMKGCKAWAERAHASDYENKHNPS